MSDSGFSGTRRVPPPVNEPVKAYAPGSPEKAELKARLKSMAAERIDIPLIIGGKEVRTGDKAAGGDAARPPPRPRPTGTRRRRSTWGRRSRPPPRPRREWARWPWEDRAAVFLKAAELLATTWRATLNAATMLGQSKTVFQAEIDAACELIDFWRFNAHFAQELLRRAAGLERRHVEPARVPRRSRASSTRSRRSTSPPIGGNLPTAPALMGNTVVWKPASRRASRAPTTSMKLLEAAGLPPGRHQLRPRRRGGDLRGRCSPTATSPASTSPAAPRSSTRCGRRSART